MYCNFLESFVSDQDHSKTLLDCGKFDELYATSVRDPEFFWGTLAKQFLQWDKPFVKVMDCNMEEGEIKWFTQGKLNVSGINANMLEISTSMPVQCI